VYLPNALEQVHSSENISTSQLLLQSGGICQGDAITVLNTLPDESVDCLVTDPPYGYSFMGKDWDKAVPSVEIWKECLRVLKSGAFAFIMSAPRQDVLSQMIVRLSQAGFRTDFTSLYWTYFSGFPKAGNIGKMVDSRNGTPRQEILSVRHGGGSSEIFPDRNNKINSIGTSPLEGSYGGFQPKPAVEIILVCMKPLSEKTYVDQALKNRKGITWLNDCRIPYVEGDNWERRTETMNDIRGNNFAQTNKTVYRPPQEANPQGRFPANLLVSDDVLNDGRVTKAGGSRTKEHGATGKVFVHGGEHLSYGDSGSFSRYFDLDSWFAKKLEELPANVWKTFPYLIVPKASKREKNKGLSELNEGLIKNSSFAFAHEFGTKEGSKNYNLHPTVKPLKLMSYLITLGSRTGDIVLDPFMGSGSTCIAAALLDRRYIGIDLNEEYVSIAKARLAQALPQVS